MQHPVKTVSLEGKAFRITGLSQDDPYFSSISDGFEPEFSHICRQVIGKGDVCVDIGANIGLKSLLLSRFVRAGQVVAIEANPTVGEILEANVAASGQGNIRVVRTAVGDRDGFVHFAGESAYGHIAEAGVRVPVRRLETILREAGLERADFIKIDVEGYEFPILRDSIDLIHRSGAVVLFEFNSWCQLAFSRTSPLEFLEWIFAHFAFVGRVNREGMGGYLVERMVPGQELAVLHANLMRDGCVTDILVTNDADRAATWPALVQQVAAPPEAAARVEDALRTERDNAAAGWEKARGERDLVRRERDAALSELAALRASRSWRMTAPLRRVLSALRPGRG